MTEAEENAMLVAYRRFVVREKMETRELEMVPSSLLRQKMRAAFRAAWQASKQYADKQGGPG